MRHSGGNWCWFPILELLSEYLGKNSDDTDFDQTDTYIYVLLVSALLLKEVCDKIQLVYP